MNKEEKKNRERYPGTMYDLWKMANEAVQAKMSYGKYAQMKDKEKQKKK